jgi:cytoskeletal protein RodZ
MRFSLSKIFRAIFVLLLVGMFGVLLVSVFVRPPTAEQALELTVQAQVAAQSTAIAAVASATSPADLEATVQARVEATQTAAAQPTPSEAERAVGQATSWFSGIWAAVVWLWNIFAFGGLCLQLFCCVLAPLGVVLALARESMD